MRRALLLIVALALLAPASASAAPAVDPASVVYRVNAGGPQLAGTPAWTADTTTAPSPYVNATATGNRTYFSVAPIDISHTSIPAGTPASMFSDERYDPATAPEMAWKFPVAPGRYAVHLYFAETYAGTQKVAGRQMDVAIEGLPVLDNFDVFATVGANKGVMKAFEVDSDASLDVDFTHVVENPAIKGIEIVKVAGGGTPTPVAALSGSPDPLAFGTVTTGQSKTLDVVLKHTGAAGAPPVVIDATQITGTNAGDFTDGFDDAADVTLQPGQTKAVPVTFAPAASGTRSAKLAVTHSASSTPLEITLGGSGAAPGTQPIAFGKSSVSGVTGGAPTALDWGPDGRLYVGYFNGTIRAYTITRSGPGQYAVTSTETLSHIAQIPNHNDDGSLAPTVTGRLVTGLTVGGTGAAPQIYVSSSDPRIGAGPDGTDLNLDTNGSTVSRLTKSGTGWTRLELVRGLPRSEENHAANGLALDPATNTLFLAQGGNTNQGGPSNNFALLSEYAYSAAVLSIDLGAIGTTTYDLPTLDDESRAGTTDAADPFGGNDGKNQAKLTATSPVQVHAPGFRNPYDVVKTAAGKLYAIDNGSNAGWGGVPIGEGTSGTCTNGHSEPGATTPDALHLITGKGYYAGHANPTRANKANTFNPSNPQSPVATANPVECDYRAAGSSASTALATDSSSTNGLAEFTGSNFGGAMKGDLVAAAYDGRLLRFDLNATGTAATKTTIASNVSSNPLAVATLGDTGPFPGTIWVTNQGGTEVHAFEPSDYSGGGTTCQGTNDPTLDEDGDGFDNADEIAAGTSPCSAADVPADFDADKTSDVTDTDDDNDSRSDTTDVFAYDAQNGTSTALPVRYTWENDQTPPGKLLGLGFTGLMSNGTSDPRTLFDRAKLTAGGAAGVLTLDEVSEGDALGGLNDQQQAFQFGVDTDTVPGPFAVRTRIAGPFAGLTPQGEQSMGLFIGNGTQDGYVKVVLTPTGAKVVKETGGTATTVGTATFTLPGPDTVDLYLLVDPANDTVQASYQIGTGVRTPIGPATPIPNGWTADAATGMAAGIISTSRGTAPVFPATWDFITVEPEDAPTEPPSGLAHDNFGRTLTGSWGSADIGGAWTLATSPASAFGVRDSAGTMSLAAGQQHLAMLGAVSARDVEATGAFTAAAAPSGSGGVLGELVLRHQQGGAQYRLGLHMAASGAVAIRGTNHTGTALFSDVATGLTLTPGQFVHLRVQTEGASPTTIRARAWTAGTTEPTGWQVVTTDGSAGPQTAGSVGIRGSNTTTAAAELRVDSLHVSALATAPPPTSTDPSWHVRQPAQLARQDVSFVQTGGKFYLAGAGTQQEVFDPATGGWSFTAPSPTKIAFVQAVVVGGKIYYVGGLDGWPTPATGAVRIYDPATNTWSTGAPMPTGRARGAGGVAVHNGKIYYAGGLAAGKAVAWFDVYDPATNAWSSLPDMPRVREHFHAGVIGNRLYATAGRVEAMDALVSPTDAFDFGTGQWVTGLAPIPTPRGGAPAAVLGGELYVIGGMTAGKAFDTVEAYDPAKNSWRTLPSIPTRRHATQAAVCNGAIHVAAGGTKDAGGGATNLHEVLFPGAPTNCSAGNDATPSTTSSLLSDAFTRTTTYTWGTADQGGAWQTTAGWQGTFSTGGGKAAIATQTGGGEHLTVASQASGRDIDAKALFTVPSGAGTGTVVGFALRRQSAGAAYRVGVAVTGTGAVVIRTQNAAGATVLPDAPTGITHVAGSSYALRVQLEGASATQIRARLWKAGTAEPTTWHASGADATLGPQQAGAIGVRSVNGASAIATVGVDDALVTKLATSATAMTARIASSSDAVAPGEPVRLTADAERTVEGLPVTYAWDTDGDGAADTRGKTITTRFDRPGRHRVTLRAIASDGSSAGAGVVVDVAAPQAAVPPASAPVPDGAGAAPVPGAAPVAADSRALVTLVGRTPRLGAVLATGLPVRCSAPKGARCKVELRLTRGGRTIVAARATVAAGRTVRLRLTRAARTALRGARSARLTLVATASGSKQPSRRVVTLRR